MSSNEENAPLWLSEGLAELYSTFQVDGDEVHIGRPVSSRVFWLRKNSLIPLRDMRMTSDIKTACVRCCCC